MDWRKAVKEVLGWNKRLFPVFVVILLIFVIFKSIRSGIPSRWLNLDYKLIFILVSGLLVLIDVYLNKNNR